MIVAFKNELFSLFNEVLFIQECYSKNGQESQILKLVMCDCSFVLKIEPSLILGNFSDDPNYLKIQFDDATFVISLQDLTRLKGFSP